MEVRLIAADGGTLVTVRHTDLPEPEATDHPRGWVYFLDRLASDVQSGHKLTGA